MMAPALHLLIEEMTNRAAHSISDETTWPLLQASQRSFSLASAGIVSGEC